MISWLIGLSFAAELETNAVRMTGAPKWLSRPRVERVTDHMQTELEWTVRRINVTWYTDQAAFAKANGLGPLAMAVTRAKDQAVLLGPKVTDANFDETFSHELTHVILRQKYKDAVPKWLEEGLANHLARGRAVDYKWLAKQTLPGNVRTMTHPFDAKTAEAINLRYVASQALVEMIAKKCDLTNLLRLSVEKGMESYLDTYCEIKDLNAEFKAWVLHKAAPAG